MESLDHIIDCVSVETVGEVNFDDIDDVDPTMLANLAMLCENIKKFLDMVEY